MQEEGRELTTDPRLGRNVLLVDESIKLHLVSLLVLRSFHTVRYGK